jgi:hypothetical protein
VPLISTKYNYKTEETKQKIIFEENPNKIEHPKKSLPLIILWILGILFAIAGLGALDVNFTITIIYFIIALLIIPFTYSKIESFLSFRISKMIRVVTILVLFLISSPFFPPKEVKKNEPNAALSEFIKSAENKPASTYTTPTTPKQDCWDLGYKFGYCATLALHGFECRPEDDVIIPVDCRGDNKATNMGIRSGTEKAFDKLGLPKK